MENIRFSKDSFIYNGNVSLKGDNVVAIQFGSIAPPDSILTNGFELLNENNGIVQGFYYEYNTIYRTYEDNELLVELSNDGSTYIEPSPTITFSTNSGGTINGETKFTVSNYEDLIIPTPVPDENYEFSGWVPQIPTTGKIESDKHFYATFSYIPTLEEVQEAKVSEMNIIQQAAIDAGVNVTLSDGTVEHFTLTDHDQTSLMGLQSQVMAGEQMIPWHTSDETEHCKFYTNADMALITATALAYVTYHVTLFRDLRIYIRSLTTKEEVQAVTYGMNIPEDFQSEPLKAMIAKQEFFN